ncbi:hypothetical protein RAS1_35340 [Phycisphaerae bacterium RAS1]|nr:hypothetical protein RAS1_35340 [Phycisphaerae bacterium RAS1]
MSPLRPALLPAQPLKPSPHPWLWPARIPTGKITLLLGDPGVGKSLLALDLAARLSAALPWPDAPARLPPLPATLSVTDDEPQTCILPRLAAAGADLARIDCLFGLRLPEDALAPYTPLVLPDHVEAVRYLARSRPIPGLLVLDPLSAFLSPAANANPALAILPLADIAAETGLTILIVAHPRKSPARGPLYRLGGPLAAVAAARSVLLLTPDPADPARRVLTTVKSSYCVPPPALAFRIIDGPRVEWLPADTLIASGVSGLPLDLLDLSPDARSALVEAREWLAHALASGPRPVRDLLTEARQLGISLATLRRAKRALCVRSTRPAHDSPWLWSIMPYNKDAQGGVRQS